MTSRMCYASTMLRQFQYCNFADLMSVCSHNFFSPCSMSNVRSETCFFVGDMFESWKLGCNTQGLHGQEAGRGLFNVILSWKWNSNSAKLRCEDFVPLWQNDSGRGRGFHPEVQSQLTDALGCTGRALTVLALMIPDRALIELYVPSDYSDL